ncbi:MAG: hypothetical protein GC206_12880 [Alphaproteobacteria bacterium]|nr:hypothetical protein [Alphaproteobacteria bacterium]
MPSFWDIVFGSRKKAKRDDPLAVFADSPSSADLNLDDGDDDRDDTGGDDDGRGDVAEAEKRIAACVAERKDSLDLSGLKLVELPRSLARLAHLRELIAARNALRAASLNRLSVLPNLTSLNLNSNSVGDAGAQALSGFSTLKRLFLNQTSITDQGVEALTKLRGLETLDVSHNKITDAGAAQLAGLTNLQILTLYLNDIGDDGVAALSTLTGLKTLNLNNNSSVGDASAKSIGARLKALESLSLASTKLTDDGAAALSTLTALEYIDLDHTKITGLEFLRNMRALRMLWANGLRLSAELDWLWPREALSRVYLHESTVPGVPAELLSGKFNDNCLPRLRTYLAEKAASPVSAPEPDILVRDIKVMILGNGRIGKTQMRRRLTGRDFDSSEPSTHGVEIVSTSLPPAADAPPGTEATPLQIWDFGGQDIYLGTHALFLKTRAVFPILWTPESEQREVQETGGHLFRNYPLREWLRYVRQLSTRGEANITQSPVLLVQAQCEDPADQRPPPVDAKDLEGFAYPPQTLRYSALPGQSQERLLTPLRDAIAWMSRDGPQRLRADWARVKAAVEERAAAGDKLLDMAQFRALCATKGVEKADAQETLLFMLKEFGTVFHDPDVLADRIILDQNWALSAIYALFDRERGAYQTLQTSARGRFRLSDLDRLVWREGGHDRKAQDAFLAMMLSCKVAFPLRPESKEFGETLYIAPDLLPNRAYIEDELPLYFDPALESETREVPFAFAVPSLMRELMAFWGAEAGLSGLYWAGGFALFDRKTKSRALLEMQRPDPNSWRAVLSVKTQSGDAPALMARIMDKVADVAERFGAAYEGQTPERVLKVKQAIDSDAAPVPTLDPGPEPRARERCFISYAHQQENEPEETRARRVAFFNAVEAKLDALGLDAFVDKKNLRNGENISRFMQEGSRSPKIVLILCAKYLRSEHCMYELWHIWKACESDPDIFTARVRAICLPDAQIDTLSEREAVCLAWEDKRAEVAKLIEQRTSRKLIVPDDYNQTHSLAVNLVQYAPSILATVAKQMHIRTVDAVSALRFG